jgi:hypothetical protein
VFFSKLEWYNYTGEMFLARNEHTVSAPSRRDGGFGKLDCFFRFDQVNHWLSRTRDLIATSETYTYPAFKESFRELRRKSRKAAFDLVVALFQFERRMERESGKAHGRPRRAKDNKEEPR